MFIREGKYAAAQAEFVEILKDANITDAGRIMLYQTSAWGYLSAKNYPAYRAQSELALAITSISTEGRLGMWYYIADSYFNEKNYVASRTQYTKILNDKDVTPEQKVNAQLSIGLCYEGEGNTNEAQKAYLKIIVIKNVSFDNIKVALEHIDFTEISNAEALAIVNKAILIQSSNPKKNVESLSTLGSIKEGLKLAQ